LTPYSRVTSFGACAVAAYVFSVVINGNVIPHKKSRTDRVFSPGGKVGHVSRHALQLFEVKRSKVKVTRSRDVSV